MRSLDMPSRINERYPVPTWATYARFWELWREPIAGILVALGLCGMFVLPSLLPLRWWMIVPLAIIGGLLRQRPHYRPTTVLIPFWIFCITVLLFTMYAFAFQPLTEYGSYKARMFFIMAIAAFVSARQQAPLTEEFARGLRWGLGIILVLSLLVLYQTRDLFMNKQLLGIAVLKESVSATMLPLSIALGLSAFLPRTVKPVPIMLAGLLFIAGAAIEIFARGRFDAIGMCVFAALLVLGPPWRHAFWRVAVSGLLVVIALAIYINVLPLMGDSFLYLSWLDPQSVGGRGPIWQVAWNGFWQHPLGQGFASFEFADIAFAYPHNIILEVAYEFGVLGLLSMLTIYLLVLKRSIQLWLSPPHRVLAMITMLVFLQMLKSGDLTTLAFHWIYLYLLVVATPISPSWRLSQGEEDRR